MEEQREPKLATKCCGFLSLTTGVNVIAGIDFFQGSLTVFLGLMVCMMPEKMHGHFLAHHYLYNETTMLAVVVMSAIGGMSAYFAWCAIKGVKQYNSRLIWRFFLWKAGRAFFFSLLLFSDVFKTFGTPLLGNFMMLFVVATGWRVYLLWVIFSLHERVANGDLEGAEAAGYSRQHLEEVAPIVMS